MSIAKKIAVAAAAVLRGYFGPFYRTQTWIRVE